MKIKREKVGIRKTDFLVEDTRHCYISVYTDTSRDGGCQTKLKTMAKAANSIINPQLSAWISLLSATLLTSLSLQKNKEQLTLPNKTKSYPIFFQLFFWLVSRKKGKNALSKQNTKSSKMTLGFFNHLKRSIFIHTFPSIDLHLIFTIFFWQKTKRLLCSRERTLLLMRELDTSPPGPSGGLRCADTMFTVYTV